MLIVMVNIERIRNQILLTERSLAVGDNGMAFAHSYIPHSAIFPSIKNQLNDIKSHSGLMLESLLTDLPIIIKTSDKADSKGKIKNDLTEIEELLDNISNQTIGKDLLSNKTMIAHTIVFLLRDAGKSYQLSNAAATVAAPINQQETDNNKTIQ
jgi:high-affinity iron transporter